MIDLHIHTQYSDGTDDLCKLLEHAEKLNLKIISITDHDTINAYKKIKKIRNKYTGKIIVGVELKAIYNNHNIEILGYGIDTKKIRIHKCKNLQKKILKYFKQVANKYKIKYDKNLKINNNAFSSVVFAKSILKYNENIIILNNLGEKNLTINNFFRKCESNPNSIFYFDASKYIRNINDIINDIHQAGGFAFLAHAYEYKFKNTKKEIINIIKTTSIDGFECIHSEFSNEQRNEIINICKKYNKYMSGGTDYHGENKPDVKMGSGKNNNVNVKEKFIEQWIKKIKYI